MAWTLKHRAISFAVTIGVTLGEFIVFGAPIAIVVYLTGMARIQRIIEVSAMLAAVWSLSVALYGHIWPPAPAAPRRIASKGEQ